MEFDSLVKEELCKAVAEEDAPQEFVKIL